MNFFILLCNPPSLTTANAIRDPSVGGPVLVLWLVIGTVTVLYCIVLTLPAIEHHSFGPRTLQRHETVEVSKNLLK